MICWWKVFKAFCYSAIFVKKNAEERLKWKRLVNRKDNSNKLWSPEKHNKVCSVSFVAGESSNNNPYPRTFIGYESSSKVKNVVVKRRSLECRHENSSKIPKLSLKKNMPVPQVVLVHDTRSKDSRSNDPQLMHKLCKHAYFVEREFLIQKVRHKRCIQRPCFLSEENKPDQKSCIF